MSWIQIKRAAWVDMRRIGPLAIAMVLFWLFILAVVAALISTSPSFRAPAPPNFAMSYLLWTVAIYATAWGAITFSMERSEKTIGFLRSLPANPHNVLWGKVLFGILSTIGLALVLFSVGCIYHVIISRAAPTPHAARTNDLPGYLLVLIAAWIPVLATLGLFWSQRTSKPMWAIIGTIVSAFVLAHVCGTIYLDFTVAKYSEVLSLGGVAYGRIIDSPPGQAKSWGAIASFLISLATLILVRRNTMNWWKSEDGGQPEQLTLPALHVLPKTRTKRRKMKPKRRFGFRRLLWLQSRQQRIPILVALVALTYFGFVVCEALVIAAKEIPDPFSLSIGLSIFACLGFLVFRREHQESRFRLLAQLGTRPIIYWASQLAVPLLAAVAFCIVCRTYHEAPQVTYACAVCLAVFSVCQFVSVACRSSIIAVAVALAATIVVALWFRACQGIGTPLWLAGGPVVVLPLLASLLRVSRWFRETRSWKQWIVPLLPIVALIGLPVVICWYRAFEVPSVNLKGMDLQGATAAELDSAKAYEQVFALLPKPSDPRDESAEDTPVGTPDGHIFWRMLHEVDFEISSWQKLTDWVNDNQPIVDQLVETIENNTSLCADLQPTWRSVNDRGLLQRDTSPVERDSRSAAVVLLARARLSEDQGEISEAWDYYASALQLAARQHNRFSGIDGPDLGADIEEIVYRQLVAWAMHKDNTLAQVEYAAVFVNQMRMSLPSPDQMLPAEYAHACTNLENGRIVTEAEWDMSVLRHRGGGELSSSLIAEWSPWEKQRMQELIDWGYSAESMQLSATAQESMPIAPIAPNREWLLARIESNTVPTNRQFFTSQTAHYKQTSYRWAENEHTRRGAICQLALIAYHMRNGEYPTDLAKVRLLGQPLPNDIHYAMENPSTRPRVPLVIGPDLAPTEKQADGKYLYGNRARERITQAGNTRQIPLIYSDGSVQFQRLFLLPEFEGWTRDKYYYRLFRTSRDGR